MFIFGIVTFSFIFLGKYLNTKDDTEGEEEEDSGDVELIQEIETGEILCPDGYELLEGECQNICDFYNLDCEDEDIEITCPTYQYYSEELGECTQVDCPDELFRVDVDESGLQCQSCGEGAVQADDDSECKCEDD